MPHRRRPSKNIHYREVELVHIALPRLYSKAGGIIRHTMTYVKKVIVQRVLSRALVKKLQREGQFISLYEERLKNATFVGKLKPLNRGVYKHIKGQIQKN